MSLDPASKVLDERLVAIVRLSRAAALADVAGALRAGGITCLEFTVTTPGALAALASLSEEHHDVTFGAGTVLDPETARDAIRAGARFIVAPTFSRETVRMCHRYGVPAMPGCFTPTEILAAWEAGAPFVKVFPASPLQPGFFKALLAPLPQLRLVPTGGIDEHNAADYLAAGAAAVGVGGRLVSQERIDSGDWDSITREAKQLVEAVRSAPRPA